MMLDNITEKAIIDMANDNLIVFTPNKNKYTKAMYKGAGSLISDKWNIRIFNSNKIVCTDIKVIEDYMNNKLRKPDPTLTLIKIDDVGYGFPLGGVLIGVEINKKVIARVIDVEYFQTQNFENKEYRKVYTETGKEILKKIKAKSETHRIEICSGPINRPLAEQLRTLKFDVRFTEITGKLQDVLENQFKKYIIKITGKDLAYDPKKIDKRKIGRYYNDALNYGLNNCPHLLKTGWDSIKTKLCQF